MKVGLSEHFRKRAKRLSSKERVFLDERTLLFQENPNNPKLRNHPLTGKLKGYFAFSITRGKRVKYMWIEKDAVIFVDVGSHDDVC